MQDLNINNASPRSIHPGIRDASTQQVPYTPEQVPQHCPLFMDVFSLGDEKVTLTTGADLMLSHGTDALDQRSKFYTHQTHGIKRCNQEGNLFFIKRLCSATAKRAHAVFYLELVRDLALPYARDALGNVIKVGGVKQTEGAPGVDEVEVYKLRWTVEALPVGDTLDNPSPQPGTMTSLIAGAVAMKYPMFAIEHAHKGKAGENFGIDIWFPHEKSNSPGDLAVMDEYKANLYRARVMQRRNERSSAGVISTALGGQYVDIPFGEEMENELSGRFYADGDLIEAYEADIPGSVTRPAPFGRFEVYYNNFDLVRNIIQSQEAALSGSDVEAGEVNVINEFNLEGFDQHAIRFAAGSAQLKSGNIHYLLDGDDGIVSEEELNTMVQDFVENDFNDPQSPLGDIAQYPFTDVYDTGFDIDTKYSLLSFMGKRPDVFVTVCTQDLALPDNDIATELSIASGLFSTARQIPESVQYGTPACRCLITGQVGSVTQNDHVRRRRLPLVMDLITKRSRYMGAGDGKMKSGFGYDEGTNRNVEDFRVKTITQTWKPEPTYFADWESGLNTVRMIDRSTAFWPAYKTVMNNDTSVLTSDINVHICCDVIRRQHLTWAMLTGNAKLTENQLLSESERIFTDLVANRYDERATFVTSAYKTPADKARGFSWAMDTNIYLNNMPTVAMMNVIARRATELAAA